MANVAVIGAQWGDEGKGKVVDWLASRADVVVRFQGGHNAGHTLVVGNQTYKLSLLPSGLVRGKLGIIGNGVVVDPEALLAEIERVARAGPDGHAGHAAHRRERHADPAAASGARPRARGGARRRARSAPPGAASARPMRTRWPAAPSASATWPSRTRCRAKLDELLLHHNTLLRGPGRADVREAGAAGPAAGAGAADPALSPSRCGSGWTRLRRAGQAHPVRGRAGGDAGCRPRHLSVRHQQQHRGRDRRLAAPGVGPAAVGFVLGIAKAYCTRVGSGPFPTELHDETGQLLGERGHEFGTVTGRRRRCGWFDAALVRQAVKVGGIQGLALTKLDVLDGLPELKICTGYRIGGERLRHLPAAPGAQAAAEPVYETMEGWTRLDPRRPLLGRPAGAGDQICPPHRGTGGGAGHAAVHQPGARRHDPGARPVRGLEHCYAGWNSQRVRGSWRAQILLTRWRSSIA